MPNRWTFEIPQIRKLIYKYGGDFKGWIDPFAGMYIPAEITNDINTERDTTYHLHAKAFTEQLTDKYNGVLFDPPYSPRQLKECYDSMEMDMSFEDSNKFPNNIKKRIAPMICTGGIAISFGWNSIGFGKKLGFERLEILMICHGGHHNDTIVTVEQKYQETLF